MPGLKRHHYHAMMTKFCLECGKMHFLPGRFCHEHEHTEVKMIERDAEDRGGNYSGKPDDSPDVSAWSADEMRRDVLVRRIAPMMARISDRTCRAVMANLFDVAVQNPEEATSKAFLDQIAVHAATVAP